MFDLPLGVIAFRTSVAANVLIVAGLVTDNKPLLWLSIALCVVAAVAQFAEWMAWA